MSELEKEVKKMLIVLEERVSDLNKNLPQRDIESDKDYQDYLTRLKEGLNESLTKLDRFNTLH